MGRLADLDAVERAVIEPTRRCHDCAFTRGTEAHGCEITRILALCGLRSRGSFDCHINDGPCVGFEEERQRMEVSGFYERQPKWRERVYGAMADALVNARGAADVSERFLQEFRERLDELGDESQ